MLYTLVGGVAFLLVVAVLAAVVVARRGQCSWKSTPVVYLERTTPGGSATSSTAASGARKGGRAASGIEVPAALSNIAVEGKHCEASSGTEGDLEAAAIEAGAAVTIQALARGANARGQSR